MSNMMDFMYGVVIHILNGVAIIAGCMLAINAFNFYVPVRVHVVLSDGNGNGGKNVQRNNQPSSKDEEG